MTDLAMFAETLKVEKEGAILVVELNGGEYQEFGESLARSLEKLVKDADTDPDVRAVIFTSSHLSRFIGHADVSWLQQGGVRIRERLTSPETAPALDPDTFGLDRLHGLLLSMNKSSVVFIAALEGSALGLGAEFAWACDLRVMAESDIFIGQPEVLLAIMPGGGGTQRLARLVGVHRSLITILDGRPLSPQEALDIGAVDAVVPKEQVKTRSIELAEHFAKRHKPSIGAIKRATYFGSSLGLEDGMKYEAKEFIGLDIAPDGQSKMIDYVKCTRLIGDLPFYSDGVYEQAVALGGFESKLVEQ